MSLGFVIARFSVWMDEVSFRVNPQILTHRLAISAPLGECMIGLGALLTIFAAWRYHVVNQAIKRGEIEADLQNGYRRHSGHSRRRGCRDHLHGYFCIIRLTSLPRLHKKPSHGIRARSRGFNRRA